MVLPAQRDPSATLQSPDLVAPRYMVRFNCIGESCEDTCCKTWSIPIDKANYHALFKALGKTPAGRQEFDAAVRRTEGPGTSKYKFALIQLRDDGSCSFLDKNQLCSVQRRFGATLLSDTCSTFPREVRVARERVELSGSLACPEVTRRLLLEQDAMVMDRVSMASFPRDVVNQVLPEENPDGYVGAFEDVRRALVTLISISDAPLAARLAFSTAFAQEYAGVFKAGANESDARGFVSKLGEAPAAFTAFASEFERFAAPPGVALGLLVRIVAPCLGVAMPQFREFCRELLPLGLALSDAESHLMGLSQRHVERAAFWTERHGRRLDDCLRNYALHYFFRHWYVGAPNLAVYLARLLARVALLRVILFADARLVDAMVEPDHLAREQALEKGMVQAVYRLTRHLEHSPALLRRFEEQVDGLAESFPLMMCLARV